MKRLTLQNLDQSLTDQCESVPNKKRKASLRKLRREEVLFAVKQLQCEVSRIGATARELSDILGVSYSKASTSLLAQVRNGQLHRRQFRLPTCKARPWLTHKVNVYSTFPKPEPPKYMGANLQKERTNVTNPFATNWYRATIHKQGWKDGDSVWLDIDLGHNTIVSKRDCRLANINAPEVRKTKGVCNEEIDLGIQAQNLVRRIWKPGTQGWVHTIESDNFGRWLVDLILPVDLLESNYLIQHTPKGMHLPNPDDQPKELPRPPIRTVWVNCSELLTQCGLAKPYVK